MKAVLTIATVAAALAASVTLAHAKTPPKVSPEVRAKLTGWGESKESAAYPTALLEFENISKKTCAVTGYSLHWSEGTFEGTATDLTIDAGKTVKREVKLSPAYATPADKTAVVQVWKTSCK